MNRLSNTLLRKGLLTLTLATVVLVLVVVYAFALVSLRPETPGQEVGISEVLRRSEAKAVTSATFLQQDNRITGVSTIDPPVFWASVPEELLPGVTDRLVANGASVKVDDQFGKSITRFLAQFVLPILLLVSLLSLFLVLTREGGGGVAEFLRFGGVGDKNKRPVDGPRFSDVGGAQDSVDEMQEISRFLKDPSAFQAMGAVPPKGVLLVGPPGCGKTLLARALASESEVPFLYLSGAEFVESLVGIGAARVRDLFAQARAMAPTIIFIDELDAVGRRRGAGVGMGHDEREQTLNQLLVEMDGFVGYTGIVVIGATNRPDILDPALVRPGRFDRRVTVYEPDVEGRREVLAIHSRNRTFASNVDIDRMAKETAGLTGADLASIINESALLAVRNNNSSISQVELDEAVDRVLLGPARRGHRLTPEERRRAAYHEAGHALMAKSTGMELAAQKVSIVARGRSIGHHTAPSESESVLLGFSRLMDELKVTMAGRAAELLAFSEASTASEGDISNATHLARRLVCTYGMSDRVGRVRIGVPEEELFLGRDWQAKSDVSEALLEEVDNEIRRLVDEAEADSSAYLKAHRKVLDTLAQRLEEEETIRGEDLDAVLAGLNGSVKRPVKELAAAGAAKRPKRSATASR